jgi:hypothetical protein
MRSDPTNATTIADLNSASLAESVCHPLRRPTGGHLIFDGRIAIVESPRETFLQRCGSTRRVRIGRVDAQAMNTHAIMWQVANSRATGSHQLAGVFLPSGRPFLISLPAFVGSPESIVLTSRHLYLVSGPANRLWRAPSPVQIG